MLLSRSAIHYHLIRSMVDTGRAPSIEDMVETFSVSGSEMVEALRDLEEYHGVVLHPVSAEVWVVHPFSTAPTNFWIEAESGGWWGNCAWCALGAAALLGRDVSITTTLGSESTQSVVEIRDGRVLNDDLYVHFPVPMVKAWDNVTYTCSTMLMFQSEQDVDSWCRRHGITRGDVQPIQTIWEFSKVWYGNHLNPEWVKWSIDEARQIFSEFGLTHAVWDMPSGSGRF